MKKILLGLLLSVSLFGVETKKDEIDIMNECMSGHIYYITDRDLPKSPETRKKVIFDDWRIFVRDFVLKEQNCGEKIRKGFNSMYFTNKEVSKSKVEKSEWERIWYSAVKEKIAFFVGYYMNYNFEKDKEKKKD